MLSSDPSARREGLLDLSSYDMASALMASALCQPNVEVFHRTKCIPAKLKTNSRGQFIQPFETNRRPLDLWGSGPRPNFDDASPIYYTLAEGVPSLACW